MISGEKWLRAQATSGKVPPMRSVVQLERKPPLRRAAVVLLLALLGTVLFYALSLAPGLG